MELSKLKGMLNKNQSIFDLPLRVVYYARVSTDKDEQLNSLSNQVKYYEEFIIGIENWTYAGGYIDEGLSGTSVKKREKFLKMISDGKNGKFDLIITKEISRFSRNTLDSIKYTQELLSYGIGVYFQSDNICTIHSDAELRLTIMSSIAQDEVRRLSERVRFGFARAIEDGRVLGQDNTLGYDKKDGKLTVNEKEVELVRTIFDMYNKEDAGLRRIARDLEKMGMVSSTGKMYSFATIRNIITNPKYKGFYCGRRYSSLDYRHTKKIRLKEDEWVTYRDENIPTIVSEEIWDKANELLKERSKRFKDHTGLYQNRYVYSGKIFCAEHGTSYHRHVYKSNRGELEVWNCKMYRLKGREEGCNSPTIYTTELEQILTDVYKNMHKQKDEIITSLVELYSEVKDNIDYDKEISEIDIQIEDLNEKKERLLELNIDGLITKAEFAKRNDKYNIPLAELENKRKELELNKKTVDSSFKDFKELRRALEKEWDDNLVKDSQYTAIVLDKIIVHKLEDTSHIKMEICLKFGDKYIVEYNKNNESILFRQIGISQAQVSRLEKAALLHMKKYV